MRVICLGTAAPKAYKNNPRPPPGLNLEKIEYFATDICNLSLETIPAVGANVMTKKKDVNGDGYEEVAYVMTEAHRNAMIRELIETPVRIPWLGGKARIKIKYPDDYRLSGCIASTNICWERGGNSDESAPGWISGNDEAQTLVAILAEELGIQEIRAYEEDGT